MFPAEFIKLTEASISKTKASKAEFLLATNVCQGCRKHMLKILKLCAGINYESEINGFPPCAHFAYSSQFGLLAMERGKGL